MALIALGRASLGLWRVGSDLGWAGGFVLQKGFLSHRQVWIAAATGVQHASVRLTRYAGIEPGSDRVMKDATPRGPEECSCGGASACGFTSEVSIPSAIALLAQSTTKGFDRPPDGRSSDIDFRDTLQGGSNRHRPQGSSWLG
jgi:hypothetical protein